jgi:predicted Zn-dependent peptidase
MLKKTDAPVVSLYIKFKAGSVDENPEMAGTAHLLEHMMFQGTKNIGTTNYKKEKKYITILEIWNSRLDILKLKLKNTARTNNDIKKTTLLKNKISKLEKSIKNIKKLHNNYIIKGHDALIYSANGSTGFNAYTSTDVTNYQINLPANKIELWARMESDRLKNPILREYYTERAVVLEERRMRYDSIGFRKLRTKYLAAAFESHPYRQPVIGYYSNIPFLNKKETIKFFKKHYSVNNMVIAIVGDINFNELEKIIGKYFGSFKPSKLPSPLRITEPEQRGEKRVKLIFPVGRQIIIGWHKPSFLSNDNITFELLSSILTRGRNSILQKKLVYDHSLAIRINSWNGDPGERYDNLFSIFITPLGETPDEKLEKAIYDEIEKIKKGDISEKIIQKHKNKMLVDFYHSLNSNSGLADNLSYYEIIFGDWSFLFDFYDKIQKIQKSDLIEISNKYLIQSNRTVAILDNK